MAAETSTAKPTAEDFLSIIREQQRGKLKVYLGSSPGVGKTYEMLMEGTRLKKRGVDVVVGYVEPHDRPETTAQIGDLEVIPPRTVKYHDVTLQEMDLDALLPGALVCANSSTSATIGLRASNASRSISRRVTS